MTENWGPEEDYGGAAAEGWAAGWDAGENGAEWEGEAVAQEWAEGHGAGPSFLEKTYQRGYQGPFFHKNYVNM